MRSWKVCYVYKCMHALVCVCVHALFEQSVLLLTYIHAYNARIVYVKCTHSPLHFLVALQLDRH